MISNQYFLAQKDILSPTDVFPTLQETEDYYMIHIIFENRKRRKAPQFIQPMAKLIVLGTWSLRLRLRG